MATFSTTMMSDDLLLKSTEYAARKLKISAFKDLQLKAILSVLRGQDAFVSLPTGYGKSAIYQAIPLCTDYLRMQTACTSSTTTSDFTSPTPTAASGSGSAAWSNTSMIVVISPLVSLMKSQVALLKKNRAHRSSLRRFFSRGRGNGKRGESLLRLHEPRECF